jgi:hypothetical protein
MLVIVLTEIDLYAPPGQMEPGRAPSLASGPDSRAVWVGCAYRGRN